MNRSDGRGKGRGVLGLALTGAAAFVACQGCFFYDDGYVAPARRSTSSYEYSTPESRHDEPRARTAKRSGGLSFGNWDAESCGPRFGFVSVTGEAADQLAMIDADPVLTLWGWQFEFRYEAGEGGPTGLVEIIPLIAGMEQELFFPSLNVLLGLRTQQGTEICVGPYISETGRGLTFAIGHTVRQGRMSLPFNLGVTSTKEGVRTSFTFGWNITQ